MEKKKGKKVLLIAIIAVILVVASVIATVLLMGGHRVIKVDDMDGQVTLERGSAEKDIVEGMNLKSKDMITTGEDGLLELLVDTDKHILAKQNTCFEIVSSGNEKKGKLKIKLEYGSSLVEIENKLNENSSVEVETPNASLSVRGTTFEVSYSEEEENTIVEVTDGVVEVKVGDEKQKVKAGQIVNVSEEGIVVAYKEFMYNNVPAFQIGHSENGKIYDVYMKELTDWKYEVSEINGTIIDEMVKDGIRIRYFVQTKEETEDNLEYLEEAGFLMSRETLTNDDGDEVLYALSGSKDADGDLNVSYRYYKELPDDMCVYINVFSLERPKVVGTKDKEDYLPLTNDCYFFFGLPEGVEEPKAESPADSGSESEEPKEDDVISVPVTEPEETEPEEIGQTDAFELSVEPIFELEPVDPEKMISPDDVPNLFRGEVTFEELQYITKVGDYTRIKQNHQWIKNALEIMCYEPEVEGVYSPLPGTKNSYDANHLNRIFSAMTDYWILDEFLPEGATCPWPENILTLIPAAGPQEDKIYTKIIRIYYGDDDYVCVDFNFRLNYNAEGTSYREGTTCMFFSIDEESGKYRFSYLMEYNSREVYAE